MWTRALYGPEDLDDWTVGHDPGDNTQATATRAAAGVGKRNVCTGFAFTINGGATAPAAISLSCRIIDGASGGSTYLWQGRLALPATAGAVSGVISPPKWLVGSKNTAMTIEFSAAGGVNTFECVTMEGCVRERLPRNE